MADLTVPILPADQSSPSSPKWKLTKPIIIAAPVTFTFCTLGVLFCILESGSSPRLSPTKYSVIIDAGSSGTRAHVFGYMLDGSGKPVFGFRDQSGTSYHEKKVKDGLSTNLTHVTESVKKLVEFAKGIIPQPMQEVSDIRLMATAGMRLLSVEEQNQTLDVTREVLRSSGFNFQDDWASVITGYDEGKYAWVIANHALGSLGGNAMDTTGIVELGGASAQVAFGSSEDVHDPSYSHSFLNFGKDAALKILLESLRRSAVENEVIVPDPCTHRGYNYSIDSKNFSSGFLADESKLKSTIQAAGNFSACREATLGLLQGNVVSCSINPRNSACTPDLEGSFLATSNFYFTAQFFGLENENDWLLKLIPKGEEYCAKEWSTVKTENPGTNNEYLRGYCFSAAYIISMLHDSLGVALDNESIKVAFKANNIPLDWALGAFIVTINPSPIANYGGNSRKILGF